MSQSAIFSLKTNQLLKENNKLLETLIKEMQALRYENLNNKKA